MYGFDLIREDGKGEMKPTEFWVTYLAADKYLVEELKDELIVGSVSRQNTRRPCLLCDQLLRMPFDKIGSFVSKEKEDRSKPTNQYLSNLSNFQLLRFVISFDSVSVQINKKLKVFDHLMRLFASLRLFTTNLCCHLSTKN